TEILPGILPSTGLKTKTRFCPWQKNSVARTTRSLAPVVTQLSSLKWVAAPEMFMVSDLFAPLTARLYTIQMVFQKDPQTSSLLVLLLLTGKVVFKMNLATKTSASASS